MARATEDEDLNFSTDNHKGVQRRRASGIRSSERKCQSVKPQQKSKTRIVNRIISYVRVRTFRCRKNMSAVPPPRHGCWIGSCRGTPNPRCESIALMCNEHDHEPSSSCSGRRPGMFTILVLDRSWTERLASTVVSRPRQYRRERPATAQSSTRRPRASAWANHALRPASGRSTRAQHGPTAPRPQYLIRSTPTRLSMSSCRARSRAGPRAS